MPCGFTRQFAGASHIVSMYFEVDAYMRVWMLIRSDMREYENMYIVVEG
jgi:hypothetical protein